MVDWERWMGAVIGAISASLCDPQFHTGLFHTVENDRPPMSGLGEILTRPHLGLSEQIDSSALQDAATVRNRIRVTELVQKLVTNEGRLDLAALDEALHVLEGHLYSLGPGRHYDTPPQSHLYRCLCTLQADDVLQRKLEAIDPPGENGYARDLIRESMGLGRRDAIDQAVTRRAVLGAWLTHLRQNVGSCFATAPAIMVQGEQPRQFFVDVAQLLSTGHLKRVLGGEEYAVPLCKSWGMGGLLCPFSLRAVRQVAASPGLQAALMAAGLVEAGESEEHRLLRMEGVLRGVVNKLAGPFTTAEEVIRVALMNALQVSPQEVHEYRRHPHAMRAVQLGGGARIGKVERYQERYRQATAAFKVMTDHPLLKVWEFTLASFADVKADFSRWNLYASLGLDPRDEGGIGAVVQELLQGRLDEINRDIAMLNEQVEVAYAAAKALESRARDGQDSGASWIRAEHSQKMGELSGFDIQRRELAARGEHLSHLFRDVVAVYRRLFPDYFQEVYDPDMHDVGASPFDDSPAGFRLLYKHGRANTALWTWIYTPDEWVQSLADFFVATEAVLLGDTDLSEMDQEISALTTGIITRIREPSFLSTAFDRAAERHRAAPMTDPLLHLEKIGKKPWAYVSGGTMTTLASAYFSREEPPTLAQRVVENPTDLLVFLLDTLKELPASDTAPFLEDPMQSMLMQSPTHGFLLKPGLVPFRQGWTDRGNSSSWVRHHLIRPGEEAIDTIRLNDPIRDAILKEIASRIPGIAVDRMRPASRSVREFRRWVVKKASTLPWVQNDSVMEATIDAVLFSLLPFVEPRELRGAVVGVLEELLVDDPLVLDRAIRALDAITSKTGAKGAVSSQQLQQIVQTCLVLALQKTMTNRDYPWEIRTVMRRHNLALPAPMLVADTNWPRQFFAFLINPGTGKLDFWRVDYIGLEGAPMAEWTPLLDGSKGIPWSLYTKPWEYIA